jgi:asparagine synthase (glutamine-hydrolysing)
MKQLKYIAMCGIVCDLKQKKWMFIVLEMSKIIRHRGPDWSGIYSNDKALCLMRDWQLLIQLLVSNLSEDGKLVLAANEIYNHRELRKQFEENITERMIVKLS